MSLRSYMAGIEGACNIIEQCLTKTAEETGAGPEEMFFYLDAVIQGLHKWVRMHKAMNQAETQAEVLTGGQRLSD